MEVNIHEAKTQLSRLLKKVEEGEEITIARAGVPVAKLIAVVPEKRKRPLGIDRGKIWISPDFDAPDPELEKLFYDGPVFPEGKPQPDFKKKNRSRKKKSR
jgi:prevent-host-death family protein